MSLIAVQSVTRTANGSWSFAWSPTAAPYYRVVLWGVELDRVTTPAYTWTGQEYVTFPPPLEVADSDDPVLSERFLPYFLVQWYGESEAAYYLVQFWDGTAWQTVAQVREAGQRVYTYRSPTLKDETEYTLRVIAVDEYENQSEPQQYRRYVVCPPPPPDPDVRVAYTPGQIVIYAR